jgi:hypothetical protein
LTVAVLVCAGLLAFAPAKASATPVLWTLNITNSSGGTVVGSFVYDASTNLYSSIAITTTVPTATFDTNDLAPIFGTPSATGLELIEGFVAGANVNKPMIQFFWVGGLTDLGGVQLVGGEDGICALNDCGVVNATNGGFLTGGHVSGTPVAASSVPEPATLFLCSAGLIGAGVRRWRQRRA